MGWQGWNYSVRRAELSYRRLLHPHPPAAPPGSRTGRWLSAIPCSTLLFLKRRFHRVMENSGPTNREKQARVLVPASNPPISAHPSEVQKHETKISHPGLPHPDAWWLSVSRAAAGRPRPRQPAHAVHASRAAPENRSKRQSVQVVTRSLVGGVIHLLIDRWRPGPIKLKNQPIQSIP